MGSLPNGKMRHWRQSNKFTKKQNNVMDLLKLKIKDTQLFTPQEKIDILASFDTIGEDDKTKLEAIIDEYDAKYVRTTQTMKAGLTEELNGIARNASTHDKNRIMNSVEKIKSGMNTVIPS